MPLILVIVADPHEAARLAKVIQGRLSVDLVQAAEVGEGLLALEDRIPDLILTSPLMSPFDDGVLDEYLRELGPAGAHVQTLRIPVLSQAPKKTKRLGFSLRRPSKPEAPAPDGCEPKVFVDEIEQYLARAAEEKRHAASNEQPVVIERRTADAVTEPAIAEERWTAAYADDEPATSRSWAAPQPDATTETRAWRVDLLDRPPAEEVPSYEPASAAYHESPAEAASPVDAQNAVEVAIAEPAITEAVEPPVAEGIVPEPAEALPLARAASDRTASEADESKASPSFKAALAAIRAAWGKPPRTTEPEGVAQPSAYAGSEPVVEAVQTSAQPDVDLMGVVEVLGEEPVDVDFRTAAMPHHVPADAVESVDVYDLSAEEDLSPLGVSGSRKKGKRAVNGAKSPSPRQGKAQPAAAQNEWGIFDPDQCGFAALVDKLDEVADKKTKQPQNGAKVRVISLS